jgi:hypothetical protein
VTRKKLITVAALAVLAIACSETVGGVMQDAGDMLADAGDAMRDAGDMMQPDAGAQDTPAECEKVASEPHGDGGRQDHYAAVFDANPGQTEVTLCYHGTPRSNERDYCHRFKAAWYEGTSTGFWSCGTRYFDADENMTADGTAHIKSITVHN